MWFPVRQLAVVNIVLVDLIAHVPINMNLQNIGISGAESLIVPLYFSKANIPGDLFNLL